MSDARARRGTGNNNRKAYDACPIWDSFQEHKTDGCRHNKMAFKTDGKECKDCGEKL